MFEQFTDSARRVMALAQESAKGLGHAFIGGEHLLLGIAEEEGGAGQRALSGFVTGRLLRREVADLHPGTDRPATGHIPFTPSAKRVLELAHRQSIALGIEEVDSAILLLGVLEERGAAVHLLQNAGVDIDALRRVTVDEVSGRAAAGVDEAGVANGGTVRCPACRGTLRDQLRVENIDAVRTADRGSAGIAIVYCGRCGAALGTTS